MLQSARPSISLAKCLFGLVVVSLAEGYAPVGEYLYVPDLTSLRLCGYAADTASCMGWYQEKFPHPTYDLTVPLCPRTILKRVVELVHPLSITEYQVDPTSLQRCTEKRQSRISRWHRDRVYPLKIYQPHYRLQP